MATDPANPSEEISQDQIDAALAAAGGQTADTPAPAPGNPSPTAAAPTDPPAPTNQPAAAPTDQPNAEPPTIPSTDSPQPEGKSNENPDTSPPTQDAAPPGPDRQPDNASAQSTEPVAGFSQADVDDALADAVPQPPEPATDPTPEPAATTTEDGSPKLDSQGRPFDEAAALMEAAIAEERAAAPAPTAQAPPPTGAVPLELPDFSAGDGSASNAQNIALLNDVKLDVKIELGRSHMLIEDVLKLGNGSVVELDKLAGDPVDILVNERLVARGEVLVLNDNFCVRISEILVGSQICDVPA